MVTETHLSLFEKGEGRTGRDGHTIGYRRALCGMQEAKEGLDII
jgi:hypothetical protein